MYFFHLSQLSEARSAWTLAALLAILLASLAMVWHLSRRWTTGRRRSRINDWARRHRMRELRDVPAEVEKHLGPLQPLRVMFAFEGKDHIVCWLRSPRTPGAAGAGEPSTWLLAGKRLRPDFAPALAALRPARGTTSLVDVLAADTHPRLWSYPSIEVGGDAFTVFAGSPSDAGQLARSQIPAKLPTDLGLLIADGWLILDLSARTPDEIELAKALETLAELLVP